MSDFAGVHDAGGSDAQPPDKRYDHSLHDFHFCTDNINHFGAMPVWVSTINRTEIKKPELDDFAKGGMTQF